LAAAEAHMAAGAFETGNELITLAESQPCREPAFDGAVPMLRGMVAMARGRGSDAAPLLTAAARALEPLDPPRARWAHLLALWGFLHAGRHAPADAFMDAARAAGSAPRNEPPTAIELLLDGFAARLTRSHAAAAPVFRRAFEAHAADE